MKTRVLSVLALSMAVAMASTASTVSPGGAAGQTAAAQPPMPDVQTLGPQVGTKVPDFSLTDQRGRTQTLTSIMGSRGAVLVFFRSADW